MRAGSELARSDEAEGVGDEQYDEQRHRQADTPGQGVHQALRVVFVLEQVHQPGGETGDDRDERVRREGAQWLITRTEWARKLTKWETERFVPPGLKRT